MNTPPAELQRILIIRPSALGDVCRTVPVLVSLRRAYPQATIDWVVQDQYTSAVAAHPALSEVVSFPRARFGHWWRSPRRLWEILRWLSAIRKRRYDLVLDCQGLSRSGLIAWASGAKTRVGLRAAREFAWLGYNLRVPSPSDAAPLHTVDEMLLLLKAIGVEPVRDMTLYLESEQSQWWDRRRTELGLPREQYAVLAPTSRWPSKRWPIERFSQLIEPLRMRGFERLVVIGSPSETEQVRDLIQTPEARGTIIDLVGQTSIGQTMAVIAGAGLVIANDSAPLHIAVGFERPCVALFGPTNPATVGPYRMEQSVVRGYQPRRDESINFKDPRLGDSLMRLISHVAVLQCVDRVLSQAARHMSGQSDRVQRAAS